MLPALQHAYACATDAPSPQCLPTVYAAHPLHVEARASPCTTAVAHAAPRVAGSTSPINKVRRGAARRGVVRPVMRALAVPAALGAIDTTADRPSPPADRVAPFRRMYAPV